MMCTKAQRKEMVLTPLAVPTEAYRYHTLRPLRSRFWKRVPVPRYIIAPVR
jgi:hypothetical protein